MRSTVVACVAILSLAGCATSKADHVLHVETSIAPIADITRQIVGSRAEVGQLVPEGTDSHTFEPSVSTIRRLARADIVFLNGLHLEEATRRLAVANVKKATPIILLGDRALTPGSYEFDATFPKAAGDPNPHAWMDPTIARRYGEIIRDAVTSTDPENAAAYRHGFDIFSKSVEALDQGIRSSIGSIPPDSRKLLTFHDSFAYFSRRYSIPVIGAVQPSDFSELSPGAVSKLIADIKESRVPAIFGSDVFPSTVLEQIARETGARYVTGLRDDVLPGRPGTAQHTYIEMVLEDARLITKELGGDPTPLDRIGADR